MEQLLLKLITTITLTVSFVYLPFTLGISSKSEKFLEKEIAQYKELVKPEYIHITKVHVTMYHAVPGQTDDTPDIVADGTWFDVTKASELRWVAVSRDLLDRWGGPLSFGDVVYILIEGDEDKSGFYRVKDTMNARWVKRVDILESLGHPIYKHTVASMYLVKEENKEDDELWSLQQENKLLPL